MKNQLTIQSESPLTQDAARLIEGSEATLRAVYLPEECFSFTAAELDKPKTTFLVARKDGKALGCVAWVRYADYGEIKRLYVDPDVRGLGLARLLMQELEKQAVDAGLAMVRLETGTKLAAAVVLYEKLGYVACGPFGEYDANPASLFMEKSLA